MLLEFKAKNYKSFYEELIFSLIPAPKQKGLDYSILKKEIIRKEGNKIEGKKEEYRGLSSAVIYGPNASGKTNIIGAMDSFRNIVLRGNLRNEENKTANIAAGALELIPNVSLENPEPVSLSIKFIEEKYLFEYGFTADLGDFLDEKYKRKILKEYLKINDHFIFEREREKKLEFASVETYADFLTRNYEENSNIIHIIAKSSLNKEELFLMNGFKTIVSPKLSGIISNWLKNKLMVVYRADQMQLVRRFSNRKKQSLIIEQTIDDAARIFGISSNSLGYMKENEGDDTRLCSVFESKNRKSATIIPAEVFESFGTVRFVNIFPLIARALTKGATLVIDELDASIHPMAMVNLINIFHNDEINKNKAQLVFNTHNPIYLNKNIFRRDEIKFVERDEESHYSTHYSLSDFKTAGKEGVRKEDDYMKNYFLDRYGAIRDIDFAPIFKRIMEETKDKTKKEGDRS